MSKCCWCNLTPEEKRYLISENQFWALYLADEQSYVGQCVLILQRHCHSLSELTKDEWDVLHMMITKLETCQKMVLGADLCNWSCLMNSFFKNTNPDPHVHIHCRPRLKNPVVIGSKQYRDDEFGHHYDAQKISQVTNEDRDLLFKQISECWETLNLEGKI